MKFFYVVAIALIFSQSCSQIVPAPVRNMPIVRVLHEGRVKQIPLEQYVASVLAGEVHPSWPIEALKAQAIASRTYAKKRMNERRNNDYDVQSSVMDQVYINKTSDIFVKAARETAGLVLLVDKELAECSFHSTCGGKTANAKSVWGRSYPHLTGVICNYCKNSPTYNWTVDLPLSDVQNKFDQKLRSIKIKTRTPDNRADVLELGGVKTVRIGAHEFRMAMGPMKVKSTMIKDITFKGSTVTVNGQGFGHGVGMCQYGALGMAKAGKKFREILSHYYPKTVLARIY